MANHPRPHPEPDRERRNLRRSSPLSQGRENYGSSDADRSDRNPRHGDWDPDVALGRARMAGRFPDDHESDFAFDEQAASRDERPDGRDFRELRSRHDLDHNAGREGYGSSGWERAARLSSERPMSARALRAGVGPHAGKGPKGYVRSDAHIHEDVAHRLMMHGGVDASDVSVEVRNGEVTLSGTVPERSMKREAEACLDDCVGVRHVQNNVRWQEPGMQREPEASPSESGRKGKRQTRH